MIRRLRWIGVAAALAVTPAMAGPDDDYIGIYQLIQAGDAARDEGRAASARDAYLAAQQRLKDLKRAYPDWNERVVAYRLRYTAEKLEALPATAPAQPAPSAPPPGALAPSGEVIDQFNDLNQKIGALTRDKAALEAKLREALTAQPAPIDPKEFQKAVESIASLQATNHFLATRLERQEAERRNLVDKVVADEAQAALNEANRKLLGEREAQSRLSKEKAEVEAALRRLREGDLHRLQTENSTLKEQVTQLKSDTERGRQVADLTAKLGDLQSRLEAADRERAQWTEERVRLSKQIEDLRARQQEDGILKVRKLETELAVARADANREAARADDLSKELEAGRGAFSEAQRQNKNLAERIAGLGEELATARMAEAALRKERIARADAEERLKAADARLAAVNAAASPTGGGPPANGQNDVFRAQVDALSQEASQLREALAESQRREADLAGLLAEASAKQNAWSAEKAVLLRRISEGAGPAAKPGSDARETAALRRLKERVQALEKERAELAAKLAEGRSGMARQISLFRGIRALTPRERAAEFRASR